MRYSQLRLEGVVLEQRQRRCSRRAAGRAGRATARRGRCRGCGRRRGRRAPAARPSSASPATTASAWRSDASAVSVTQVPPSTTLRPRRAEVVGEIVGAADLRAHGGDADDVAVEVEVDVVEQLVDHPHVVARRRQGRRVGQGQAAGPVARRLMERAVGVVVRRRDEEDAHQLSSTQASAAEQAGLGSAGLQARRRPQGGAVETQRAPRRRCRRDGPGGPRSPTIILPTRAGAGYRPRMPADAAIVSAAEPTRLRVALNRFLFRAMLFSSGAGGHRSLSAEPTADLALRQAAGAQPHAPVRRAHAGARPRAAGRRPVHLRPQPPEPFRHRRAARAVAGHHPLRRQARDVRRAHPRRRAAHHGDDRHRPRRSAGLDRAPAQGDARRRFAGHLPRGHPQPGRRAAAVPQGRLRRRHSSRRADRAGGLQGHDADHAQGAVPVDPARRGRAGDPGTDPDQRHDVRGPRPPARHGAESHRRRAGAASRRQCSGGLQPATASAAIRGWRPTRYRRRRPSREAGHPRARRVRTGTTGAGTRG